MHKHVINRDACRVRVVLADARAAPLLVRCAFTGMSTLTSAAPTAAVEPEMVATLSEVDFHARADALLSSLETTLDDLHDRVTGFDMTNAVRLSLPAHRRAA